MNAVTSRTSGVLVIVPLMNRAAARAIPVISAMTPIATGGWPKKVVMFSMPANISRVAGAVNICGWVIA